MKTKHLLGFITILYFVNLKIGQYKTLVTQRTLKSGTSLQKGLHVILTQPIVTCQRETILTELEISDLPIRFWIQHMLSFCLHYIYTMPWYVSASITDKTKCYSQ